ncbi:MAG: hypothetical protein ACT4PG_11215 [Panacagrimonas sp.]
MRVAAPLLDYVAALSLGKTVLWCYLIWYLVTLLHHFDPAPRIWLNALGISAVIGVALVLSVNRDGFRRIDPWPTFRLFLMPFCVSSFSQLLKNQGFVVILPPRLDQLLISVAACAGFVLWVQIVKRCRNQ